MPLHVQGEVVGSGEASFAVDALEGLDPRVLPVMTGQLVRPGEPPFATLPGATIRFLACKKIDLINFLSLFLSKQNSMSF